MRHRQASTIFIYFLISYSIENDQSALTHVAIATSPEVISAPSFETGQRQGGHRDYFPLCFVGLFHVPCFQLLYTRNIIFGRIDSSHSFLRYFPLKHASWVAGLDAEIRILATRLPYSSTSSQPHCLNRPPGTFSLSIATGSSPADISHHSFTTTVKLLNPITRC
jgi:hypothetical protein